MKIRTLPTYGPWNFEKFRAQPLISAGVRGPFRTFAYIGVLEFPFCIEVKSIKSFEPCKTFKHLLSASGRRENCRDCHIISQLDHGAPVYYQAGKSTIELLDTIQAFSLRLSSKHSAQVPTLASVWRLWNLLSSFVPLH